MKRVFIIGCLILSINTLCFIPVQILIEMEYCIRIIERLIRIKTESKLLIENHIVKHGTIKKTIK